MQKPIRIELPTIFGMKTVNTYLFLEPEPILIDCGEQTEESWQVLKANLAKYGLSISDVKKVYITHAHIDHIGMAGRIAEESQAEIWISNYMKEWVFDFENINHRRRTITRADLNFIDIPEQSPTGQMLKQVFGAFQKYWAKIPLEQVRLFDINDKLNLGNQKWDIIYAPGHCIHQVCFYQSNTKSLLSADMLLSITPAPIVDISLNPPYRRTKSIRQLIDSFHKFKAMDIDTVYPGHYEPFGQHKKLITKQLERMEQRKQRCFELIKQGRNSFYDILRAMYEPKTFLAALPMLVGYLDLLQDEKLVEIKTKEGKLGFYAV